MKQYTFFPEEDDMNAITHAVLVTGASSGIGRACCSLLAQNGFNVFTATRKLSSIRKLQRQFPKRIYPVRMDVTDEGSIMEAVCEVDSRTMGLGLESVINCAGVAIAGPMECLTVGHFREQFEVNTFGTFAVIKAFLPLIRSADGRIINIGSISGSSTFPFSGCYSASKAALKALSHALRLELQPWRIPVVLVEPGIINTPLWKKAFEKLGKLLNKLDASNRTVYDRLFHKNIARKKAASFLGTPPEKVAEKVFEIMGLKSPRFLYTVGPDAALIRLAARILPQSVFDGIKTLQYGLNQYIKGE